MKIMSKFIDRIFFLSKLSTSIFLLLLLILLSYLFAKAYLEQDEISANSSLDQINRQLTELTRLIELNTSNLNVVQNSINNNESFIRSVDNSINKLKKNQLNEDMITQLNQFSNENKLIKNEIHSIVSQLKNLNSINKISNENHLASYPINNIFKLIELKLINGTSFVEEVMLLRDLHLSIEQTSYVDKLLILSNNNFVGLNKLYQDFESTSSKYLNNYYINKSKTKLMKYLFNFISIKPNSNVDIQDNNIHLLNEAKLKLKNNDVEEAINKITSIKNAELFFNLWIEQAKYHLIVQNSLHNILELQ